MPYTTAQAIEMFEALHSGDQDKVNRAMAIMQADDLRFINDKAGNLFLVTHEDLYYFDMVGWRPDGWDGAAPQHLEYDEMLGRYAEPFERAAANFARAKYRRMQKREERMLDRQIKNGSIEAPDWMW